MTCSLVMTAREVSGDSGCAGSASWPWANAADVKETQSNTIRFNIH